MRAKGVVNHPDPHAGLDFFDQQLHQGLPVGIRRNRVRLNMNMVLSRLQILKQAATKRRAVKNQLHVIHRCNQSPIRLEQRPHQLRRASKRGISTLVLAQLNRFLLRGHHLINPKPLLGGQSIQFVG